MQLNEKWTFACKVEIYVQFKVTRKLMFNIRLPWEAGPLFLTALKTLCIIHGGLKKQTPFIKALEKGLTGTLVSDEAAVVDWAWENDGGTMTQYLSVFSGLVGNNRISWKIFQTYLKWTEKSKKTERYTMW